MKKNDPKLKDAATIRARFKEAIDVAFKVYCECEQVAAYAILEVSRLEKMRCANDKEEFDRDCRIKEKAEVLDSAKRNLRLVLDRIHILAMDRDKTISDIYVSSKIMDIEDKLAGLTPWLQDLSDEMRGKAESAKLYAKLTSEIMSVSKPDLK